MLKRSYNKESCQSEKNDCMKRMKLSDLICLDHKQPFYSTENVNFSKLSVQNEFRKCNFHLSIRSDRHFQCFHHCSC